MEQNTTVVFPMPINLFEALIGKKKEEGIPVEAVNARIGHAEKLK